MKILLDTTVLIDALRVRNKRREFLADLVREGHALCTTVLNVVEIYSGMRPQEERGTVSFLAAIPCLAIDEASGRLGGQFKAHWGRKGRTIPIVDCVVAAVAVQNGCVVATDNRKDFPMQEVRLYPLP